MIAFLRIATPKGPGCRYIAERGASDGYGHNGWKFAYDRRLAKVLTWQEVDLVQGDMARGVLSKDYQFSAP